MLEFTEKERAFLSIITNSEHQHISQDSLFKQLVETEILNLDEFKLIKKKLLYSGIIGIVYGNITLENKEIIESLKNKSS